MINKFYKGFLETLPILVMIGLIPLINNDYLLTGLYVAIILLAFKTKYIKHEWKVYLGGFILMIFFEWIFISTGVETFIRNSLFGVMPLWLPFLWGYGFVAVTRVSKYLMK